jgi:nitrous oxidase accessory protein
LPLLMAVTLLAAPSAHARTWSAAPGEAARVLALAAAGDTVVLARGVHAGPVVLARVPLVLRGAPGAVVDAHHRGTAIEIGVDGARIEDLAIRGSGSSVMNEDAAVRIVRAANVRLARLHVRDALYGVYAERAASLSIADCDLAGRVQPLDELGDGNGIHLWYCNAPRVERNRITRFVDALYFSFTNHAVIAGNLLHDCGRYGFHTMYCQDGELLRNRFTRNVAGCAIMFSNHLDVRGNAFADNRGPRTYGLLLRDCSDGTFRENRIVGNTIGVFMDDSNRNHFTTNLFQDDGWGLLLYSSCAGDTFARNGFLQDDYPVALDMRTTDNAFDDGRVGNYWGDQPAYDLDGDRLGDTESSPVTAFAFLSKQYPDLTLLAKSPAVEALGVAEQVLPALRPSEAVDHHPLIAPPPLPADATPLLETERAPHRAAARTWGGAAAFALLGGIGVAGLASGRVGSTS